MPESSGRVQSLAVATKILELMAEGGGTARVTDLASELGLTKARVSRHLSTMIDLGLVVRDPGDRTYRLGALIFQIAERASRQLSVTSVAGDYLKQLGAAINETVLLVVPYPERVAVVVDVVPGGGDIAATVRRGETIDYPNSASGRVLVAFSQNDDEAVDGVTGSRADKAALVASLQRIREEFYEVQAGDDDDVAVVAAPIFNRHDEVEGCVTVVAPNSKRFASRMPDVITALKSTAAEISLATGSSRWIGHEQ